MSGPGSKIPADQFYVSGDPPPQQGDILIGTVARVVAEGDLHPIRWAGLDQAVGELMPAGPDVPALRVAAGRELVMVTTHDCGLDKEFNARVRRTVASGADEHDAIADAEAASELDRSFQVSPLVDPGLVTVDGTPVSRDLLMAGKVVGYLPVPPLVGGGLDGDQALIPESVVDLSYRATVDRLAYTARITSVSESARQALRYSLARLDALRSPLVELELAAAVGQRIQKARVAKRNPLVVELTLEDGSVLRLLKQPGSPEPGGPSRTAASTSRG